MSNEANDRETANTVSPDVSRPRLGKPPLSVNCLDTKVVVHQIVFFLLYSV